MDAIEGLEIFLMVVALVALPISLFANRRAVAISALSISFIAVIVLTVISIVGGKALIAALWAFNAGMDIEKLERMVVEEN